MQSRKRFLSLDEIFNDADFGLIEEKKKASYARTPDDRLLSSFMEINDFVDANNREPEANISNVSEFQLYSRLKSLRDDDEKVALLQSVDKHHLLSANTSLAEPNVGYGAPPKKKIESIDDLLQDDLLDLLSDDDDEGLFDFKHVPKIDERAQADFVARRKPCKDFDKYKDRLAKVQQDLANGKRKLVDFKQDNLQVGAYYVHNGVLFFLEKITIKHKEHYKEDGTRVREDGRTRCVFENGTESNMLKRSVEKILYANGKVVTENIDDVIEGFDKSFGGITKDDNAVGYIYVLKSKSTDERIASISNLFKIGYSTTDVTERIQNAENEPTYLMAKVDYISGWQCYNMNPQKFEQLIHNFFGASCLELDVFDEKGKRHTPREWFIVPLEIIEQVVALIITGEVVNYCYDVEGECVVGR
ncbi:MAG: GIY-YIG nuclease family protein [Bacteroidales bacterium]|jgi:hypothetical protein|nr:GIY-YIG nuclease family protein [Bacteroidales bacterium]